MKSRAFKILISLIIILSIFEITQFLVRIDQAKDLAYGTRPPIFCKEDPEIRILIAGDSIGEGVGAKSSSTIAAFLHEDFPDAEILNVSESGCLTQEVFESLKRKRKRFDLILLFSGANDIMYFTPLDEAKRDMRKLLKEAKSLSKNVILTTSGNIGLAPIFPEPVSWYMSFRTRRFLKEYERIAKEEKVIWVDLYKTPEEDLLSKHPRKYYAPDMLHLSGKGYKVWYEKIREAIRNSNIKLDGRDLNNIYFSGN